jgi:hypothetical protein
MVETRVGAGPQVDVVGFSGARRVIEVEVKWRERPIGKSEAEKMAVFGGKGVAVWVVSKAGFEKEAERILRDAGIWFSDARAFNEIRRIFGFPEVKA